MQGKNETVSVENMSVNRALIREPGPVDRTINLLKYGHRMRRQPKLQHSQVEAVNAIKSKGYVVLPGYFDGEKLRALQVEFQDKLNQCSFEMPAVAQTRIDEKRHAPLIKRRMSGTLSELSKLGVTFSRDEAKSYGQVIEQFRPSTLKVDIPSDSEPFFQAWLDEYLLQIVEAYLGLRPTMVEAYVRRNFPAKYRVMNHFWHRDVNCIFYLVKMFVFLSDCTVETGPHHYIEGSHRDLSLNHPSYYSDEEIESHFDSNLERISEVKAGTVIIEDTRGLHKAGVVSKGFRDLGYAIFYPMPIYQRFRKDPQRYFEVSPRVLSALSRYQKSFLSAV